jgi:hypothetical protein
LSLVCNNIKCTFLESCFELFAINVFFDCCFLFWHLCTSQPAKQELFVVLVSREHILVLSDIELGLAGFFVGFGLKVI